MNESSLTLLLESMANLSNRIHAIECAFIDYCERNPKSDSQWTEQRLIALEAKVKECGNNQVIKADVAFMNDCFKIFEKRLDKLEQKQDPVQYNPWDGCV